MRKHAVLIALLAVFGLWEAGCVFERKMREAQAQDSALPGSAQIISLTLTGQVPSTGTTKATIVNRSGTWPAGSTWVNPQTGGTSSISPVASNLVPCFAGGITNVNTSTAHTLVVRAMPRGAVVRYVYFPAGTNATYDSVGVVHGDAGGYLTIEAESGSGADMIVAGDYWYRQPGN